MGRPAKYPRALEDLHIEPRHPQLPAEPHELLALGRDQTVGTAAPLTARRSEIGRQLGDRSLAASEQAPRPADGTPSDEDGDLDSFPKRPMGVLI